MANKTENENSAPHTISYSQAGVNIHRGHALVNAIAPLAAQTHRPGVLAGLGGFGALFELDLKSYQNPVLVSTTDGVGTKLKLATALNKHDTIGIDLVAMCVNDIITMGAEPLFFLDYYASAHLDIALARDVIQGISNGCQQANIALVGGESAEMPGMYQSPDYDLAGFCVGIVDKNRIIDGSQMRAGDKLLALASSGAHSNGYSLIRSIVEKHNIALQTPFGQSTLGEALLAPTRIYCHTVLSLAKQCTLRACAHITGGGLAENLARVLNKQCCATIDLSTWQWPELFHWLARTGPVNEQEMLQTFNCGVGMVLCVAQEDAEHALQHCQALGEQAWIIGEITQKSSSQQAAVHLQQ